MEVFVNGTWGTVCDNSWDLDDADVVCKMLGYKRAMDAPCCSRFGQGSGYVLFDKVRCSGSETNIAQCEYLKRGHHGCGHDQDSSVRCTRFGKLVNM